MGGKIVGTVLAGLVLAGCSGTGTAAPSPSVVTVTASPTPTPAAPVVEETTSEPETTETTDAGTDILFLGLVRGQAPQLEKVSDSSLIELARSVCEAYDKDATTTEIGAMITGTGVMTLAQTGYFIGVTTSSYCPEHDDE